MEKPTHKNSVGDSILKGACNPKSTDLAVQLGEIGLDSLMDEGLLKQIPFLKGIVACKKTWEAIHDQLFLRKVAGFILACPEFTEAEREQFAKQHLSDAKSARQLGDGIVLILDRLDDLEKPQLLARAFAALVRAKIDVDTFRRMASAIDKGFVEDLKRFVNLNYGDLDGIRGPHLMYGNPDDIRAFYLILVTTGITEIRGPRVLGEGGIPKISCEVSELGKAFYKCMHEQ